MYIPDAFAETESNVLRAFMREHPFATMVTSNSTGPPLTGPNPPPSPLYLTSCLLPDAKKAVEFPIRHAIG